MPSPHLSQLYTSSGGRGGEGTVDRACIATAFVSARALDDHLCNIGSVHEHVSLHGHCSCGRLQTEARKRQMIGYASSSSYSYLDLLCLRDAVLIVPQVEGSAHFVQHVHVGTRHFLFKVSYSLN